MPRRGPGIHQQRAGTIALVQPVRQQALDVGRARSALAHVRRDLLGRAAEGEGLALGEAILQRQILALRAAPRAAQRRDEIEGRRLRALMQQLKEGMLGVRRRLSPDDRRRGEVDPLPGERDGFSVALHFELLKVGGQSRQPHVVRQHGQGRQPQESAVPHAEQAHQHGQIPARRAPS